MILTYSLLKQAIAPLKQADDAMELITDNLSIEEVIAKITELYHQIID